MKLCFLFLFCYLLFTLQIRTLRGCHRSEINALAWNKNILATGEADAKIINHGVRVREHLVETFQVHQQDVCGLKWSASGQQLASGGNDNLVWEMIF